MNSVKFCLLSTVILPLILMISSCDGRLVDMKVNLNEGFSLHIGQSAFIVEEDIIVKFAGIAEDSRCPRSVVCVWEGRVIAIIEILGGKWFQQLRLSQPGSTNESTRGLFGEYEIMYRMEPYPEEPDGIRVEEYNLIMTFSKIS